MNASVFAERLASKEELSERDFVKILVATLVTRGNRYLEVHSDSHQENFRTMLELLEAHRVNDNPATRRIPQWFADPVTGTYAEFDQALLDLQAFGITRCDRPFTFVELAMDGDRAEEFLAGLEVPEQQLIFELAAAFLADMPSPK